MNRTALILALTLAAPAFAQVSAEESAAFGKRIDGLVKTYYPALANERHPPRNLLLGFLVDANDRVLEHSVAIVGSTPASAIEELARMFPRRLRSQLRQPSAACVAVPGTSSSTYCVAVARVVP